MRFSWVFVGLLYLVACATQPVEETKEYRIADTNVRLAVGYMQQGRLDDALVKLKKALEAIPDYKDAHSAIALVYDHLGKYDLASEHYKKAIKLDPDNGLVYNNYGVFLCTQNRLKEAEEYFMLAVQKPRYATPERAYENAGACAKKIPDNEKAEIYLRKALTINPKLPLALYTMAQITYEQKRYMSTRAYLQRFEDVSEHTAESLWLGIEVERQLGNKEAEEHYSKLLQTRFPDSLELKKLLDTSRGGT